MLLSRVSLCGCIQAAPTRVPRDESPRRSARDELLSDGARGIVATVVAEKRGRRERAPNKHTTVKISVARLKKALDDKDRRAVVTTVLKWVVMATTALVNVATVVELVG